MGEVCPYPRDQGENPPPGEGPCGHFGLEFMAVKNDNTSPTC